MSKDKVWDLYRWKNETVQNYKQSRKIYVIVSKSNDILIITFEYKKNPIKFVKIC